MHCWWSNAEQGLTVFVTLSTGAEQPGGLLGGIKPILKGSQFTGAEGGGNHCTADNETEKLGLDLAVFNAFE